MRPKINIIIDTNLVFYKFAYVNAYRTKNYLTQASHKRQFIKDITNSIKQSVNNYLCVMIFCVYLASFLAVVFRVCLVCVSRERSFRPCEAKLRSGRLRRSPASGSYIKPSF